MSESVDGCQVRMPNGRLCGWTRDGRALDCAAHRKRMQLHGDYRAHVPVTRKPSRRPEDVAARRTEAAQRALYAAHHRARARAARRVMVALI